MASIHDAFGALLGSACGDAAGAVLEFQSKITAQDVDHAMRMPGGGMFSVAPGQVTDDGEMMICLARSLADRTFAMVEYQAWYKSSPFDCGGTIRGALCSYPGFEARPNYSSKANGSLMRAAPLGVWGVGRDTEAIAIAAHWDSRLTHPNPTVCDAVAAYAMAIAHLIEHPGDRKGAFDRAFDWVCEHGSREVRSWMIEASQGKLSDASRLIGFAKHGFVRAFAHLEALSTYEEAIRETLLAGGDTDTNACIVGGMIGAAEGLGGIPLAMRNAVLNCDTTKGRPRPEWLHPAQLLGLADRLLRR